ncbi:glycerate kinase [Ornithinimicrobium faecis]|uniref:Glycerate kinase n=1 Tax=Ornithinimicrobium faecis TaxID=2934158 RepID=A0ABY4YZ79_9MICO|nr:MULTISPECIES: glycerate kinase [unclassified Ornithinimicrobium]USQ81648.1 glycerate kinase [Ornithinimicrobium sp. HY1793]
MRVVLATGSYADTPGPLAAAVSLAQGWARHAPADQVIVAPLSDGGSGFVEVLAHALDVQPTPVVVTGPTGADVPAQLLLHEGSAYIEAGQAAGRHLAVEALQEALVPAGASSEEADRSAAALTSLTSRGVGELIAAALEAGATRIVLGCGDLASHDGGRGLLQALGAGEDLTELPAVRDRLRGTTLVLAHATTLPLTGFHGASAALGTEHGVPAVVTQRLEEEMGLLTERITRILPARKDLLTGKPLRPERTEGAGVGGGVGYAAILLGATPVVGASFVIEQVGLVDVLPGALLVTGGEAYDYRTVHDGVIAEAAQAALEVGTPSIVLAQRIEVGRREGMSLGVSGAYDPRVGEDLADLAERVARTWSPRHGD